MTTTTFHEDLCTEQLQDAVLLDRLKEFVKASEVVHHLMTQQLKEVFFRRLYQDLGYSSFKDFAVESLGFTPHQALAVEKRVAS